MITLRDYQNDAVNAIAKELRTENNALVIAPTGAGKTVILGAAISRIREEHERVLVIQHTGELLSQNKKTVEIINPGVPTSIVKAEDKDTSGIIIFASIQTLSRGDYLPQFLDECPVDILVIDEAHHCAAKTYVKVVRALRLRNPKLKIIGVTATPNRADKKHLSVIFNRACYSILLSYLIDSKLLVPPHTYHIVLSKDSIKEQEKEEEPAPGESIAIKDVVNFIKSDESEREIVMHWQQKAHNRKTVAFCSTIYDALALEANFKATGIKSYHVNGCLEEKERERILKEFSEDECASVLTNVSALGEGWDCPAVSCVILKRSYSQRSPYLQMIGRGLRTHPGKEDCIILDFGLSSERHGSLDEELQKERAYTKRGPAIEENVKRPVFDIQEILSKDVDLDELNVFRQSRYRFETINERMHICPGRDLFIAVLKDKESEVYNGFIATKIEGKWEASHRRFAKKRECLYSLENALNKALSDETKWYSLRTADSKKKPPTKKQVEELAARGCKQTFKTSSQASAFLTAIYHNRIIADFERMIIEENLPIQT